MICFVGLGVLGGIYSYFLCLDVGLAVRCQSNPVCTDVFSV